MLFFCLFQYFEEQEYQTESKRNETFGSMIFGTNVVRRAWSASQEAPDDPVGERSNFKKNPTHTQDHGDA